MVRLGCRAGGLVRAVWVGKPLAGGVMKALKVLRVNYTGKTVSGDYGEGSTVSGYRGHDWTRELSADTVGIDSRPVAEEDAYKLAICGPMLGVDLPPRTISRPFGGTAEYTGEARALDCVSLDVFCELWEQKGARIVRGEDAIREFAAELSRRN